MSDSCRRGAESGSPAAKYRSLLWKIHFYSPSQFVLWMLIHSDGWGNAWKSRASQTVHQEFLIRVLAVSSGGQVAAMVPKSDSQNQESDAAVHKRLPKMYPADSLSYYTRPLSRNYTLRAKIGAFCLCKK